MLEKITVTGVDDSNNQEHMLLLHNLCDRVEFGILVSQNNGGRPRYPTLPWAYKLLRPEYDKLNLSLHVCGSWMRRLLLGEEMAIQAIGSELWDRCQRVQFNSHGIVSALRVRKVLGAAERLP